MSDEGRTKSKIVLPKSQKFYLWVSALYGFCAINDIGFLFWNPTPYASIRHWDHWIFVGVSAYFIWFFFKLLSNMENRIEEIICVLSMIRFASSIAREMGYHWTYIRAMKWVNIGITSLAAVLVLVRTLQVAKEARSQAEAA